MFQFPEVIVQKLISYGIKELRSDKRAFYDLFAQYTQDELNDDYGITTVDEIWQWFSITKIPVIKAWSFNAQLVPCISIHLANETEDEQKAAIGDIMGTFNDFAETNTATFTVMVDLGIHTNRAGDNVLWLYYIVAYILFKHKLMAERLGLKLQTFSASDYNKEASKMTDNIWTRWIRFRCTTENFWSAEPLREIDHVNTEAKYDIGRPDSIAASKDVDLDDLDPCSTKGIQVSPAGDPSDDEDLNT